MRHRLFVNNVLRLKNGTKTERIFTFMCLLCLFEHGNSAWFEIAELRNHIKIHKKIPSEDYYNKYRLALKHFEPVVKFTKLNGDCLK